MTTLTPDLMYLALTAILTATLWIPYVVAQVKTNGFLQPENYVDPTARPLPAWGKRADRVYINAVETFAPYAALVVVAHLVDKAHGMTMVFIAAFFWLRLAHAVVYWFAVPYVRTLIFTLGWVSLVAIFFGVIR